LEMHDAFAKLERDVQRHLDEARNLSRQINITRPKPIIIHYVPELDNLSFHESGERMKEAFENVMKHPLDAVEKVGKEVTGFFADWLKRPLKLILTIGVVIIGVIILVGILKRGYKKYQDKRHPEVVAMGMVQKLAKPYKSK